MKHIVLTLPRFAMVVSTRAALGAGIGLLVSPKLPDARRRALGAMLVAIGVVTTIPAVMSVRSSLRRSRSRDTSSIGQDDRLLWATRFPRKGDEII